jgi:hypothetical protein
VISGWSIGSPDLPPIFLLTKDITIFGTLLILVLYFFLRYRRAASEVERQKNGHAAQLTQIRGLLSQQIETYQRLMSHTRASFYEGVDASIYQHRFTYVTPGLQDMLRNSLDRVLTAIRNILESHFRARDLPTSIRLFLSVKALVTGAMVSKLCTLTDAQKNGLNQNERYIITLDRDHDTRLNWQEREFLTSYYEIGSNSDFSRIISGEQEHFVENDLKRLEALGKYRNSNPDWSKFYNATQVVPIWHRRADQTLIIFGFLTVDSLNPSGLELFDKDVTRSIVTFGADLLALLFLALEMYDQQF